MKKGRITVGDVLPLIYSTKCKLERACIRLKEVEIDLAAATQSAEQQMKQLMQQTRESPSTGNATWNFDLRKPVSAVCEAKADVRELSNDLRRMRVPEAEIEAITKG